MATSVQVQTSLLIKIEALREQLHKAYDRQGDAPSAHSLKLSRMIDKLVNSYMSLGWPDPEE